MSGRPIRTAILSATAFFATVGVLSVGYSAYSALSSVAAGDKLTAASWTQVKNNFDDIYARISNFSVAWANVGLGNPTPVSKFSIVSPGNANNGTVNPWTADVPLFIGMSGTNWLVFDGNQIERTDPTNPLYLNFNSQADLVLNYGQWAGGKVGIGTTTPTAKLDVLWNLRVTDGTQGDGKLLTSDANGLASWTGPGYQAVTANVAAGTTVSASNDVLNTADVTLTPGIWKLDLWYYLNPSATNGCFDVHVDVVATSGSVTTLAAMPNFNSETAYAAGRHGYLSTSQLVSVNAGSNALVHGRRYGSWCWGAYYTTAYATLTMIATKVR